MYGCLTLSPLPMSYLPINSYQPSTVSQRLSVVVGFYRVCVIDAILEHSPADYVRRPTVPAESPTLGLGHLQFEALIHRRPAVGQPERLRPGRPVGPAARRADPRTTMRYDRARKNLDRHPNYILAEYMASGT
jgi:hypothetical protein